MGERIDTKASGEIMLEHLHRYAIAIEYAAGKKTLDVACGDGYGASLLSLHASEVTGADISNTIVDAAKRKYSRQNLSFIQSAISQLPFEGKCFDLITSFETLEHIEDHHAALCELKRILKQDGLLIISTPDKTNYSDQRNYVNPYHVHELTEIEFKQLIRSFFKYVTFYKQSSELTSIIHCENDNPLTHSYTGNFEQISQQKIMAPLYWIAIASDNPIPEKNVSSLFYNTKMTETHLEDLRLSMKATLSYKIGHFLLWPFKKINDLFKKG